MDIALMITFCGAVVCLAVALGYRIGVRATFGAAMQEIGRIREDMQKMCHVILVQGDAVGELLKDAERRQKDGSTDTYDRIG